MAKFKKYYTSIVLAGYICFLFFLLSAGNIRRFINPRLSWLTVVALITFCGMLLASLRKNGPHNHRDHSCNCGRDETERFSKANLILLLPLFLSFFVNSESLSYQSSNTATLPLKPDSAQIQITAPSVGETNWQPTVSQEDSVLPEYQEYTQLNIGDILFNKQQAPKQKLTSSKIFLQGLVLHSPELKADEIVVYRMVISCCVADAVPLGVTVKLPEGARFYNGEWIGVEGAIQLTPFRDELKSIEPVAYMVTPEKVFAYFTAARAYRMKVPGEQYLYP